MSAETPIQTHLIEANAAYASNFTHGDLALPPAKKYLVCKGKKPTHSPISLLTVQRKVYI